MGKADFHYLLYLLYRWEIVPGMEGYLDLLAISWRGIGMVRDGCKVVPLELIEYRAEQCNDDPEDVIERIEGLLRDCGLEVGVEDIIFYLAHMGGKRL